MLVAPAGLLWLIQTTVGECAFGTDLELSWCSGCFMPAGLTLSCPYLAGTAPPAASEPGSLLGTVVFTAACVLIVLAMFVSSNGSIQPVPAVVLCCLYAVYAAYQVLAQRHHVPAACVWGVCI